MHILKEPFIHFIILGAIIFGVSTYMFGDSGSEDTDIFVDEETVQSISRRINKRSFGKLSREEFLDKANKALEEIIQQEILYREGISINLDKNDMVIKKRIAYKMNMIAIEKAILTPVSQSEIQQHYKENSERYTISKRITFRHILFSKKKRGLDAVADCKNTLDKIKSGELSDFDEIAKLGDNSANYKEASLARIKRSLGEEFAQNIDKQENVGWIKSIKSKKGIHLVEIVKIAPAKLKPLKNIATRIKAKLESIRDTKTYTDYYQQAKKKYSIIMEKEF